MGSEESTSKLNEDVEMDVLSHQARQDRIRNERGNDRNIQESAGK